MFHIMYVQKGRDSQSPFCLWPFGTRSLANHLFYLWVVLGVYSWLKMFQRVGGLRCLILVCTKNFNKGIFEYPKLPIYGVEKHKLFWVSASRKVGNISFNGV
ncbi:hypothetical protein L1049_000208 [Liquidambar formosana]|uniref:Uncharacterized protein n=1 Tax=Liquidambar formosana TaxID=63359 RepID=A0AAP0N8D4_LIQFO